MSLDSLFWVEGANLLLMAIFFVQIWLFQVGSDRIFHNGIFLLLSLSWLGCLITGVFNSYLLYLIPVYFFYYFRVVNFCPQKIDPYVIMISMGVMVLYQGLKIFSLSSGSDDLVVCTHSDDMFYVQNVILIKRFGVEAGLGNVSELLMGVPYKYSVYHYFEYYIVLLIHSIIPTTVYSVYHFVLWPLVHSIAVVFVYSFLVRSWGGNRLVVALSALVLFLTLRFVLIDELFFKVFEISDRHISFFKNYANSHTMSFWFGLKNSLALITVLPVIYFLRFEGWRIAIVFAFVSVLVTIISNPLVFGLIGFFWLINRVKVFFWLVVGASSIYSVAHKLNFTHNLISLNNLLLENYYWAFLPFLVLGVYFSFKFSMNFFLYLVLAFFPLVFIDHNIGFKIFILSLVILVFIFRKKIISTTYMYVYGIFIFLYASMLVLVQYNLEFSQIFHNYLFVLVVVLAGDLFISFIASRRNEAIWVSGFLFFYLLFVSIPPLFYDVQVPNRREKVDRSIVDPSKKYSAVSIAEFSHLPFIHQDLLGDHLLAKFDNFLICQGGYEFLSNHQYQEIKQTARVTSTNYFFNQASNIKGPDFYLGLISSGKINCLMVEDKSMFDVYRAAFSKNAAKVHYEPNRNYYVYIF